MRPKLSSTPSFSKDFQFIPFGSFITRATDLWPHIRSSRYFVASSARNATLACSHRRNFGGCKIVRGSLSAEPHCMLSMRLQSPAMDRGIASIIPPHTSGLLSPSRAFENFHAPSHAYPSICARAFQPAISASPLLPSLFAEIHSTLLHLINTCPS